MTMSESSSTTRKIRPFPIVSILASIVIPLLTAVSWPFWSWYVDHQVQNATGSNYAPDPGQFSGFAVIGAVVMTGVLAAVLGLGIAWFASQRNERCRGIRIFAWVVNGLGTAFGIALLVNYLVN